MTSDSDRKKPQQGSESEKLRRLQAVVDSMADGLILFDMNGNILDMNPEALRIIGYKSID